MHRIARAVAVTIPLLFLVPAATVGAGPEPSPSTSPTPVPRVPVAVSHHSARIGNRTVRYTATAGTIVLTNAKDEPTASIFYVAYVADDPGPIERRPLTFAYNGGPGASSAFIELGAFAPRMVVTTDAATTPPAPYEIVDNPDSLLDVSDLVFIDAVGTGFSRIIGHATGKDFYGIDQDGRAFEQFIRRYITANRRWNSPKYLAGESYGTLRSAVVAKMLQDDGIALRGITLISTVLDYDTLITQAGNDLPYWLYLPTEAAVAAYHHKSAANPGDLTSYLQTVRAFAQGPFMSGLAKGAELPAAERDALALRLHAYTGLPVDYLVRSRLRVEPERFEKQLFGSTQETVGRYDGRFRGYDWDPIAESAQTDPTFDAITPAFTAAFNGYVRDELHYASDAHYDFMSDDANRQWQWYRGDSSTPAAANVLDDLRDAMTSNPYLRVFSANGIYDLATPFFATEYQLHHLGVNAALQTHITFGYYPAGHMFYLNPVAHAAFKADLQSFYR